MEQRIGAGCPRALRTDSLDEAFIFRRNDNLYEFGGGLVWEFVKTWLRR